MARTGKELRARVWVEARHFFSREDAQQFCWAWLLAGDGRVHALRLSAACHGRDDLLPRLLAYFAREPNMPLANKRFAGGVWPLPAAPVVPVPRWAVSWGHPLQRAIRAFARQLDEDVLEALGELEAPGPFFGSVGNYNRLALLPQPARAHRVQALREFPPLVAPLLLDAYHRPDLFGTDEDEPATHARCDANGAAPVLEATDHGRDLIGALARHWRCDRALVRSPPFREPWASGAADAHIVALLQAIPAHARPRTRKDVEARLDRIAAWPIQPRSRQDVARLGQVFARGWNAVWAELETRFPNLSCTLRDTRDFLRSALEQTDLPAELAGMDMWRLALAWCARRGLLSLLEASRRWHAQPLVVLPPIAQPASAPQLSTDAVTPLFGAVDLPEGHARELTTRQSLIEEGDSMHHCVGGYWSRCLMDGTRFVHLETPGGGAATAMYDLACTDTDEAFELSELRGACNRAPSAEETALAKKIEALLNSTPLRDARGLARLAAHTIKALRMTQPPAPRRDVRPLDNRSRDELRQVLAWARLQADWVNEAPTLYAGGVAGFGHGDGARVLGRIAADDALALVREPGNPHDPRAVRVEWNGVKLGYVPRAHNADIARRLDAGETLRATVSELHHDNEVWSPVQMVVQATR